MFIQVSCEVKSTIADRTRCVDWTTVRQRYSVREFYYINFLDITLPPTSLPGKANESILAFLFNNAVHKNLVSNLDLKTTASQQFKKIKKFNIWIKARQRWSSGRINEMTTAELWRWPLLTGSFSGLYTLTWTINFYKHVTILPGFKSFTLFEIESKIYIGQTLCCLNRNLELQDDISVFPGFVWFLTWTCFLGFIPGARQQSDVDWTKWDAIPIIYAHLT